MTTAAPEPLERAELEKTERADESTRAHETSESHVESTTKVTCEDVKTMRRARLSPEARDFLREVTGNILASLRLNRLPMIVTMSVGAALIVSYYAIDATRPAFDRIAAIEKSYGVAFSAVSTCVFGGLLPLFFQIVVSKSLPQPFAKHLAFAIILWLIVGCYVKAQYKVNELIHGSSPDVATVIGKAVFDQFIFCPFLIFPLLFLPSFRFRDCGFQWQPFLESFRDRRGLLLQYCSMLVANWCIWIPGVLVVYSFPGELQIPVFNVICFFFSAFLTLVSASTHAKSEKQLTDVV